MDNRRRGYLIVLLAGLAVRLPLWLNLAHHPEALARPDTPSYIMPAKNLLHHGAYSAASSAPYKPDAERTPGYPLFLAAHFLVSEDGRWPAATQAVLDAGTGVLAAAAASSLSAHPAAWMAGLLYALDPIAAAHALILGSEPLFNFLLTLSLFLLLRAGRSSPGFGPVALSGLCLGAATWTRPISVYLWLPWSLALAWSWPGRFKRHALTFAAAALLLPALWCARNGMIWGNFGYNPVRATDAVLWEASAVQASIDKISFDQARAKIKEEAHRRHPQPFDNPIEEARFIQQVAHERISGHYFEALRLYPVSTVKMLLGPGLDLLAEMIWPGQEPRSRMESPVYKVAGAGTLNTLKERPILWAAWAWISLLLALDYGLSALGAWALWRARSGFEAAVTLVPLGFLTAISAGGWAYYRHRVPLLPLLAALAGAAFDLRWKARPSERAQIGS